MIELLSDPQAWITLITLSAIEIVLALGVFVLVRRGRLGDVRAVTPRAP